MEVIWIWGFIALPFALIFGGAFIVGIIEGLIDKFTYVGKHEKKN